MENFRLVREKLEAFIRKYYFNLILKGALLFLATGLLYFLLTVSLEYFLWLGVTGRTILFWSFIAVQVILLIVFVGLPLFKLLKLSEGINQFQASQIIGKHFPEVNDKLTNLLQLEKDSRKSDLLFASIEQRSKQLYPIPFLNAIDLKKNRYYLRYVLFPVLIIAGLIVAGKAELITGSFHRIADYNTAYEKPAPFSFIVQNNELKVREDESFLLQVKIVGDYFPENVQIETEGNTGFMKQNSPGVFEYKFDNLKEDTEFHLNSNNIRSQTYNIAIVKVPRLLELQISLDYPSYTGVSDETISGTGNLTVPEGTRVKWNFSTRNTSEVWFRIGDSLQRIPIKAENAALQKTLSTNLEYSVSTSNAAVQDFEQLQYAIEVVKDEFPEIDVMSRTDSLDADIQYFKGSVSDDYGLIKLELVYAIDANSEELMTVPIPVSKVNFDEFVYTFPGNIALEEGQSYTYFFRVYDNDGFNGAKSARSSEYTFRKKTSEEIENEQLQQQSETIKDLGQELQEFDKSEDELEELSRLEKENEELNYNEKKKLEEFLKRQERQNEMMKNYSEKLKESFDKNAEENDSKMNKELSRRMEENEERLQQNEELLKELEKYSEKIDKEDLGEKLDELSKKNKNSKRSLEQLLELTKRYYVEEKKQKLARDLEKLAEEQEELSKESDNSSEKQEELNEKFRDFQEEMDGLEKENKDLKKPQELGREKVDEESIKQEQENAKQDLQNNVNSEAKKKQEKAAEKMKEMSAKMQQMAMQQDMQQLEVDADVLRQILDNLIVFSFEQEDLLDVFKQIDQANPRYAGSLKKQSELRENFNHIDDSLYTLALRNPMINEKITEKLTDVNFDLEKSIDRLSDNQVPQGTSSQQYVVTGANDLANLLDGILGSMQEMMANPQSGSGEGENEFQLQDIIEQQQKLQDKMQEGMESKPGEIEKESTERGQEGQESGEGENGKIYEIFKEQQMLRMQMEKMLQENGIDPNASPTKEMEEIEEDLLDKGMSPETMKRMEQLQYELIKFDKAVKLQGQDEKRRSETNVNHYRNSLNGQLDRAKEYFNSTEILNRQILPLRQIYRQKVKDYFGKGRD